MQVGHRDRPEWASYRFWPLSQFEHCERSIRAAKAARCAPRAKHALTRLMKSCQMPLDAANGWSQAGQRPTSPINEQGAQALGFAHLLSKGTSRAASRSEARRVGKGGGVSGGTRGPPMS